MPRPYVLLSVAQSLDGYIDDPSPDRLVLSSPEDLDRVDEVRAGCDAIMVGAVTLRRDNPRLRVKSPERRAARKARGLPEELLRVIVTRSGKLGRDLRVWTSAGEKIIYCPDTAAGALRETLGDLAVVAGQGDTVDLGALLDDLGARGIGRLMVEGGEQVHTQFLAADLADELHVTIGGFFVADPAAPRFVTPGVRLPQNAARRMQLIEVSKAGETAVLRYMVRPKALSSPSRVPTHATPPPNSAGASSLPQYVDAGPTAPIGAYLGSVTIECICFGIRVAPAVHGHGDEVRAVFEVADDHGAGPARPPPDGGQAQGAPAAGLGSPQTEPAAGPPVQAAMGDPGEPDEPAGRKSCLRAFRVRHVPDRHAVGIGDRPEGPFGDDGAPVLGADVCRIRSRCAG